jgi:hypothetical protein
MFFIFTEQDTGSDVVLNADSITHIRIFDHFFRIFVAGDKSVKIDRKKLKDLLEQLSAESVMIDLSEIKTEGKPPL